MAIHFHYQNKPWGPNWDRIRPPATASRETQPICWGFTYRDPAIDFPVRAPPDFCLEVLLSAAGFMPISIPFVGPSGLALGRSSSWAAKSARD
jgi:hypothetical protein